MQTLILGEDIGVVGSPLHARATQGGLATETGGLHVP